MSSVGIIVNPASGKDIRRIVAQGWVVTNQEKTAITCRLLRGLEAAGIEQVWCMPERRGICQEAYERLGTTRLHVCSIDMPITARQEDSTRAAARMVEAGVGCIITLGGDGTNRAVFKGSGTTVPLLPVSTGTNNVFPEFQEGTAAGYAAGLVATGRVSYTVACQQSKVLLVYKQDVVIDIALIDLAISRASVIGARAIWEVVHLQELFLTRAQPWSIGLSAIGGCIYPILPESPHGLHLVFGAEGRRVQAPIGPGLFKEVTITQVHRLSPGEKRSLCFPHQVLLAFDGERDRTARVHEELAVELSAQGPWVIDTPRTLTAAAVDGSDSVL
jgi:predicted polyphosphate/ATP-dependent NAD kinase